jgi:hypothetical protein
MNERPAEKWGSTGFLLGFVPNSGNVGYMFLRNVAGLLSNKTTLKPSLFNDTVSI